MDQSLARSSDRPFPRDDALPPRLDTEAFDGLDDGSQATLAAPGPGHVVRSPDDRPEASARTPLEPTEVAARPGVGPVRDDGTIDVVAESYSRRECSRCGAPLVHLDRSWGRTWACSACGHRSF